MEKNRIRAVILVLVLVVAALILLARLAGGRPKAASEEAADVSAGTPICRRWSSRIPPLWTMR